MNRDELIERITQAGFPYSSDTLAKLDCFEKLLESPRAYYAEGYRQGAAVEREACIDIAEQHATIEGIAQKIIAAIRARGQV